MVTELWLPEGVTRAASSLGGLNVETGATLVIHTFHLLDKVSGRRAVVKIPADSSMSKAQIEDMAANAFESWLLDVRAKAQRLQGKHKPSPEERKEVGIAIRQFRAYAKRRRESTTGKIYL